MNQQLFNFIVFCAKQRNMTSNASQSYELYNSALINALRFALILHAHNKRFVASIDTFWTVTGDIKPLISTTNLQFSNLFNNLCQTNSKILDQTLILNHFFNTNFQYTENYSLSLEQVDAQCSALESSVRKRLDLAAKLDTLAILINQCQNKSIKYEARRAHKLSIDIYKYPEVLFKQIDTNNVLTVLTGLSEQLTNINSQSMEKIKAATAVLAAGVIIASAIAALVMSAGFALPIAIGVAGLLVGVGLGIYGAYKTDTVLTRMSLPEAKPNILEFEEEEMGKTISFT